MSSPPIRGVRVREESEGPGYYRDTRSLAERWSRGLADPGIACVAMFLIGGIGCVAPATTHVSGLFALAVLVWHLSIRRHRHLPLRLPRSAGRRDINHPLPGRRQNSRAAGMMFLGNAVEHGNQELWLSRGDVLTHDLILGVTGAGKTVSLTGAATNYLAIGGGLIYIDAKAAPALPWDIAAILYRLGREDDLLLVNYMTGNRSVSKGGGVRMTNTANPFASGSADSLVEIMSSLIPSPEGDNAVFGERALSMITAVLYGLVDLRDGGHIDLGVETFRDYLPLSQVEALGFDPRLTSDTAKAALMAYLKSLPNWEPPSQRKQVNARGQSSDKPINEEATRQHGFAQMYFTRALSSLTDTYGHIYRGSLGEVDYVDVVRRRRVLVVLLPALEKSLAGLSNLGKINLSALKDAISTGLGGTVEGTRKAVLETLPTASPIPSKVICDEYGYMAVEGFAVVAAQARGLGFSVSFGGQDWAGIKRGSEIEAEQIWGNTNLKIFGKLQDQESYSRLAIAVGEAQITQAAGFNLANNSILGYADNLAASLEKRARTDFTDLQAQIEGEVHVVYGGQLVRARMFYANPPPVPSLQINRYLRVGEKLATPTAETTEQGAGSPGLAPDQKAPASRTTRPPTGSPPMPPRGQPSGQPPGAPTPDAPKAQASPPPTRLPPLPPGVPAPPPAPAAANPPHRSVRDVLESIEDGDDADLGQPPENLPNDGTDDEERPDEERTLAPDPDALATFVPLFDDLPESVSLAELYDGDTPDRKILQSAIETATEAYPDAALQHLVRDLTPDQVAADLRDLLNTLIHGTDGDSGEHRRDHEPGI